MKKSDYITIGCIVAIIALFASSSTVRELFSSASRQHGYIMSFGKFALLASFGEMLALRIVSGCYWKKGFGLLTRMLVWGFLGIFIKAAFTIFAAGTPYLLESIGFSVDSTTLTTGKFSMRLLTAFTISCTLNIIFAPVMMTLHKITDTRIAQTRGDLASFLPINFSQILGQLDWETMWHFVFKKTIPFFWIPAHTITFLLPAEFRILFAAILGIMLGLILAIAGSRKITITEKSDF